MKRYFFAWWDKTDDQLALTGGEETNINVINEIQNKVSTLGHFLSDQFYYEMLRFTNSSVFNRIGIISLTSMRQCRSI